MKLLLASLLRPSTFLSVVTLAEILSVLEVNSPLSRPLKVATSRLTSCLTSRPVLATPAFRILRVESRVQAPSSPSVAGRQQLTNPRSRVPPLGLPPVSVKTWVSILLSWETPVATIGLGTVLPVRWSRCRRVVHRLLGVGVGVGLVGSGGRGVVFCIISALAWPLTQVLVLKQLRLTVCLMVVWFSLVLTFVVVKSLLSGTPLWALMTPLSRCLSPWVRPTCRFTVSVVLLLTARVSVARNLF